MSGRIALFLTRIRRHLRGGVRRPPFQADRFLAAVLGSQNLMRVYYATVLFFAVFTLADWDDLQEMDNLSPLWPVFWLKWVPFTLEEGTYLILCFYSFTSLLGAFYHKNRAVRVLVFLGLLEFIAFKNSFGKINHGAHLQLLLGFFLIFLPRDWTSLTPSRAVQASILSVMTACQAMIMLSYSMAGLGKIVTVPIQIAAGEVHNFAPSSLPLHIAQRLLDTNSKSILGEWLISHYWAAWPLMLGTIYLQFFALWAAFRPELYRFWVFSLVMFHAFSTLTMTINFNQNCLYIALFFLLHPSCPARFDYKKFLLALPVWGWLLRRRFPAWTGR
jgi:hypothetical protein